jgi:lipopolysaccharide biosynthesis glycosyltransferase
MINLMLAGNRKVQDGLLIVVLSYLMHNKEPVSIYFLTMDMHEVKPEFVPLSSKQAEYLDKLVKQSNPESSFHLIDMEQAFRKEMGKSVNLMGFYTPYTLLRLFADFCPKLPDKVLYLDTDIVIGGDIKPLFDTDIEDYEFAAASDMLGRFWIYPNYQNAGVMLLNMKKIKETHLFENCRQFLNKKKRMLMDQDALNHFVQKRKYFSMKKYNEQGTPTEQTVIKHFPKTMVWLPFPHTRNIKPWQIDRVHSELKITKYDKELEAYLAKKEEFEAL